MKKPKKVLGTITLTTLALFSTVGIAFADNPDSDLNGNSSLDFKKEVGADPSHLEVRVKPVMTLTSATSRHATTKVPKNGHVVVYNTKVDMDTLLPGEVEVTPTPQAPTTGYIVDDKNKNKVDMDTLFPGEVEVTPTTEKPVIKPSPKPITNTKPIVNTIDNNDTKVSGKAKSGSTVYAIVNKKFVGQGVTKNGKYSFTIKKLPAGTNVQVYSVYKKVKSPVITTKVIDKTPPTFTSLNAMTTKSQYASGKGEKYAAITVMRGNKQIATGKVSSKNIFKVKVGAQKRGTTLTVYLKDKAGNVSKKSVKVS